MDHADRRENLILGTAGHIDHGKTELVRALTGTDTDRLPEEKARGITIELGFAALDLEGELRLSVVDVPGHEGLVRTMVSGAASFDLVLLVVAADEGVMPQTREHVAICDLLGIERGVVALTKVDLVDDEVQELAALEVRELLAGTSLAESPLLPVSATAGRGLDELRATLLEVVKNTAPRTPRQGPPRLPVDRIFAVKGFGAVVTGTLLGGALSVGDSVVVEPSGTRARIRGLQSHGVDSKRISPGARCALNLQGVEIGELARGEVVTLPGALAPTRVLDVGICWLSSAPPSDDNVSIEFLTGCAERRARLAPIGAALRPGQAGFGRIHIDGEPLPALPGDRFIARGFARTEGGGATLGGGVILDVAPPHRRRSDPALLRELEIFLRRDVRSDLCERILRSGLSALSELDLARQTGITGRRLDEALQALLAKGEVLKAGTAGWIGAQQVRRLQELLLDTLDDFHRDQALRPGMPQGALRGGLPENVPPEVAELALARLVESGSVRVESDLVRRSGHRPQMDAESTALVARISEEARAAGLEPPSLRDWADRVGLPQERFRDLLAHLEREGTLVQAPGNLWFASEVVDALRVRLVAYLREHGQIETRTYKDLIGTTRRTAVPLMELFDELRVTRRRGDTRILRDA